jgi:hypothetical protein
MIPSRIPLKNKSLKELRFMVGKWKGTFGNDFVEEHWMPALEGNMTGMFRWIKDGEIYIYEIMALIENDEKILFYLRHFDKEFTGIEEKDKPLRFILTGLDNNQAIFVDEAGLEKGFLSYNRIDDNTLRFSSLNEDGSVQFELRFNKF